MFIYLASSGRVRSGQPKLTQANRWRGREAKKRERERREREKERERRRDGGIHSLAGNIQRANTIRCAQLLGRKVLRMIEDASSKLANRIHSNKPMRWRQDVGMCRDLTKKGKRTVSTLLSFMSPGNHKRYLIFICLFNVSPSIYRLFYCHNHPLHEHIKSAPTKVPQTSLSGWWLSWCCPFLPPLIVKCLYNSRKYCLLCTYIHTNINQTMDKMICSTITWCLSMATSSTSNTTIINIIGKIQMNHSSLN